jgi:hypothetical protein
VNVRIAVLALTVALTAVPAAPAGVYHADPGHLWNRLHDALFFRVGADGQEYGRDRVEPLLWHSSRHLLGGESHQQLLSVLAEFNRGGAALVADPLKRAMLQRDLWLVFSWLEHDHDGFYGYPGPKASWAARQEALRRPLARAIGALALTPRQVAALPDNYAAAVASHEFADRFDPRQPDRPYLPPDLFAADGPWVCLGRGDQLIAPSHVLSDNPFTTSAFLVFIKLPGGRAATRDYVARLSAFNGPPFVSTPSSRAPEFPNYNPAIPQFLDGTEVALVRRALLVTSTFDVAASPVTEDVQVRVYRRVPKWSPETMLQAGLPTDEARALQSFSEFVVSRTLLFAGRAGGLRPAAAGDKQFLTGFSTHGIDPFDARPGEAPAVTAARPRGTPHPSSPPRREFALADRCFDCHNLPGVFSFNTFAHNVPGFGVSRTRLSVASPPDALLSAVAWKRKRADWLLLQSLLREPSAPSR